MRICKDGDVRKKEFLEVALDLFSKQGYDDTTVHDIISMVGVTKGSFYYYFKTKEEVIDNILGQYQAEMKKILDSISNDASLDPVQKIVATTGKCLEHRLYNRAYFERLYRTLTKMNNSKLRHQLNEDAYQLFFPYYRDIVAQGASQGLFDIPAPDETAELYFSLHSSTLYRVSMLSYGMDQKPENETNIGKILYFYQNIIERILGTRKDSIPIAAPMMDIIKQETKAHEQRNFHDAK